MIGVRLKNQKSTDTYTEIMLMMNDLGSMAAGMMPFDPMCGSLYEQQPPKPRFIFKMPRVVPDQKNKFETDELFRRLSRESDVSNLFCLRLPMCVISTYQT